MLCILDGSWLRLKVCVMFHQAPNLIVDSKLWAKVLDSWQHWPCNKCINGHLKNMWFRHIYIDLLSPQMCPVMNNNPLYLHPASSPSSNDKVGYIALLFAFELNYMMKGTFTNSMYRMIQYARYVHFFLQMITKLTMPNKYFVT